MMLQVLGRGAAEEAETCGVVVATVDAARPHATVAGLQEDGIQLLHDAMPDLHLCAAEPKVALLLYVGDLQSIGQ